MEKLIIEIIHKSIVEHRYPSTLPPLPLHHPLANPRILSKLTAFSPREDLPLTEVLLR
jgi:hypothetical protein